MASCPERRTLPCFSRNRRLSPSGAPHSALFLIRTAAPFAAHHQVRKEAGLPSTLPSKSASNCHSPGSCLDTQEGNALLFPLVQRSKYSTLAFKECPASPSETEEGLGPGVCAQCFCLALGGQASYFPRSLLCSVSPPSKFLKK